MLLPYTIGCLPVNLKKNRFKKLGACELCTAFVLGHVATTGTTAHTVFIEH